MTPDLDALTAALVRDEQARLSADDLEAALSLALLRYGDLRPVRDGAGVALPMTRLRVPAVDAEAVACYAASTLLTQLAAAAMNDSDATITADTVDRRTKADGYARRAAWLLERWTQLLGLGASPEGGTLAAGVVVGWGQRTRNFTRCKP